MSKNRTGFTLLELLIVIVMIGVLLALAMPKLNTVEAQSSTRSVSQKLAAQLATARAAAIHSGFNARVTLASNAVTVETSDSLGNYTRIGQTIPFTELGVTVTGTPASVVVFDPRGFATGIGSMQRFIIDAGTVGVPKDTVCVAKIGLVRPDGCNL